MVAKNYTTTYVFLKTMSLNSCKCSDVLVTDLSNLKLFQSMCITPILTVYRFKINYSLQISFIDYWFQIVSPGVFQISAFSKLRLLATSPPQPQIFITNLAAIKAYGQIHLRAEHSDCL